MWNTWIDKAKQAAEALDQQLNESVGADVPPAKKPILSSASSASGTADASNVWNDDDFKFDDDDEETTTPAQPAAPAVDTSNAMSEPLPITPTPTKEEPVAASPENVTTESPAASEPATPKDDTPDFDNFNGVASDNKPLVEEEKPQNIPEEEEKLTEEQVTTPIKLTGSFPSVPQVSEINFLSPFSSLMTSISNDQDAPAAEEEEEKTESIPASPMKEETEPAVEDFVKQGLAPPEAANDSAAWQEEELDLDAEEEKMAEEQQKSEPATPDKPQTPPMKEEKKPEEVRENNNTEKGPPPPQVITEHFTPAVDSPRAEPESKAMSPIVQGVEEYSQQPQASKSFDDESQIVFSNSAETMPPTAANSGPMVSSAELEELKGQLARREEQLQAKAEQMFELQQMHEKEKQDLMKKVADTKEEAKKRLLKARERCEAAEAKLQASTSALSDDASKQAELVATLREEGQKLAMKQAEMEKNVRTARGEARQLQEQLEDETSAKDAALEKIEKLQMELMTTQDNLESARKGESQAGKLEMDLAKAKEDIANKANAIMVFENTLKELKTENKELTEEVEASRTGAAVEHQKEFKKMRKEHNAAIADLESKLQTSEREAGVREDSLRHEVEELRKRWQDAVRRADALNVDVQSSTAPLLRQLESMERHHRARASAAADLETKLRAELEETVIQNEKLTKDHAEIKIRSNRLERQTKEQQSDLEESRKTIDDLTSKITRLEEKLRKMEYEAEKRKEEYEKVERLANEGVSKVRSEMNQAMLGSEERYRSQLETTQKELLVEKEKRRQLEQQIDEIIDNAGAIIPTQSNAYYAKEAKPAALRESEGQAQILSSALVGLSGDDTDDNYSDDEDVPQPQLQPQSSAGSSFAALSQLTTNLKSAKEELESLRKRLAESEKTRESLTADLGESRDAKEKLPLFEAKVKELMADNREKELEIQGLQEDISEVKEMYRAQLNMLLEEKAAAMTAEAEKNAEMNGSSNESPVKELQEEPESVPELVEDTLEGIM